MNENLSTLLYQRYPRIFAERHYPGTVSRMGDGIACGDGWFHLIDTLCECLQHQTDHNAAPQIVATQLKEKFGLMRFRVRMNNASDIQRGMILLAEALSERIDEEQGRFPEYEE